MHREGGIRQAAASRPAGGAQQRGAVGMGIHILQTEGVRGLYRGLLPGVVRHCLYSSSRICLYENFRHRLSTGISVMYVCVCVWGGGGIYIHLYMTACETHTGTSMAAGYTNTHTHTYTHTHIHTHTLRGRTVVDVSARRGWRHGWAYRAGVCVCVCVCVCVHAHARGHSQVRISRTTSLSIHGKTKKMLVIAHTRRTLVISLCNITATDISLYLFFKITFCHCPLAHTCLRLWPRRRTW